MNGSVLVSATPFPASLIPGQQFQIDVTFRNTGNEAWIKANGYKVGVVGDDPRFGAGRFEMLSPSIPPGALVTVPCILTAPATGGTYSIGLQMLRERVEWFGAIHRGTVVVSGQPGPSPGPGPGPSPSPSPSGPQFPPCEPGDIVSVQPFVLNDPPPTMTGQPSTVEWTHTGPPMLVDRVYHWLGVDMGARADIHAEVYRKRDGMVVSVIQADHYAEPTGPGDNCKWIDFAHPFRLKTGDTLVLSHFGNNFNPSRVAHYGIRLVLWGRPA